MERARREKKGINFKSNGFSFLEKLYAAKSKKWRYFQHENEHFSEFSPFFSSNFSKSGGVCFHEKYLAGVLVSLRRFGELSITIRQRKVSFKVALRKSGV
jgi:hypothetical protein